MNSSIENLVIVGGGCAGYTAGIYAGRANLKPLLIEGTFDMGLVPGGQLTMTSDVENFPGFAEGILGMDLMDNMREQAVKSGAVILEKSVVRINFDSSPFEIFVNGSSIPILSKSIILATGATAKRLGIDGESKYWMHGISACAVCDGSLFKNKNIIVVGGGDSAMEEALYLAKKNSVTIVHRGSSFRASKVLQTRVLQNKNIKILMNSQVTSCSGGDTLQNVVVLNNISNESSVISCSGLFYALGHTPNNKCFIGTRLNLDSEGYIVTDSKSMHTNIPGVFAAGDIQDKKYKQAITACASGCAAALDADRYLACELNDRV